MSTIVLRNTKGSPLTNTELDTNFSNLNADKYQSGASPSFAGITDSGNLTFTGTSNRITGDFSNTTIASRAAFQTSTVNGQTTFFIIPNGTSTNAGLSALSDSAATNGSEVQMIVVGGSDSRISSLIRGTGTYLPLTMYTGGSERLRIDTSGNVGIGTTTAAGKLTVTQATASTTAVVINGVASRFTLDYLGNGNNYFDASGIIYRDFAQTQKASLGLGSNTTFAINSPTGYADLSINSATGNAAYLDFLVNSVQTSRIASDSNGVLYFYNGSANTERMRIDAAGVVGIGTTTPSSLATGLAIVSGTTVGTNNNLSIGPAGGSLGQDSRITFGSTFSNNWAGTDYGTRYSGAIEYGANGGDTTPRSWSMRFLTGTSTTDTPTERMRIDNAGNISIATSANSTLSTVVQNSNTGSSATAVLRTASNDGNLWMITSSAAGGGGSVVYSDNATGVFNLKTYNAIPLTFGTSNAERMRIDSSGNVGIGVTNPSYTLDVLATSGSPAIQMRGRASDNLSALIFNNNTGNASSNVSYIQGAASATGYLAFGTANTGRMNIDYSGNIQIGNTATAPNTARYFDIYNSDTGTGAVDLRLITSNVANTGSAVVDIIKYRSGGFYLNNNETNSAAFTAFGVGASERMRIDASGNVLIGGTTANGRLTVQGYASTDTTKDIAINRSTSATTIQNAPNITFSDGAANNTIAIQAGLGNLQFWNYGAGVWNERMRIDSGGHVLIQRTTAYADGAIGTCPLQVPSTNGTSAGIAVICNSTTSTAQIGFVNPNGTVGTITSGGSTTAFNTSSDYRLKENVLPMQNALNVVQQLKPVTYSWKTDGSKGQGFIAHELQAIVPDCVTGEKDAVDTEGKPIYQGIDTSFLVATLTAAIQEQQALITDLTTRLTALEGK